VPLQLEPTIGVGDILMSLTVLLSAIALILSLAKDRTTRVREQADIVRSTAASAIVSLDRWQSVELSLYQELQPLFVELSEELPKAYDVVAIRDRFWMQVNLERTRVARHVLEEQLSTAYLGVLSHLPAARADYVSVFNELTLVEDRITQRFLAESEHAILKFEDKQAEYQSAQLGNALRAEAAAAALELKEQSDGVIAPVRNSLLAFIGLPDTEIVAAAESTNSPTGP